MIGRTISLAALLGLAAETAFKARGSAAQKKLAAQDENGFGWTTGFAVTDGAPGYQCDLST